MDIIGLFPYIILVVLTGIFLLQIFFRDLLMRAIRSIFFFSFFLVLAYLVYIGTLQYQAFLSGPLGVTLHTVSGLRWFFGYASLHYFNTYTVSLIASFLLIFVAQYFHKKRN